MKYVYRSIKIGSFMMHDTRFLDKDISCVIYDGVPYDRNTVVNYVACSIDRGIFQ